MAGAPGQKNSFKWPLKLFSTKRWRIDNILSHHYPREEQGVVEEEVRRCGMGGGTGEKERGDDRGHPLAFSSRIISCVVAVVITPPPQSWLLFCKFFSFSCIYSRCADQISSPNATGRFMFLFNESHSTYRPLHPQHTHQPLSFPLSSIAFSAQGCEWVPRVSLPPWSSAGVH